MVSQKKVMFRLWGIEDVVNYISFLASGAFVPSFTVRAVDENEKVSLEKLQKI